MRKRRVATLCVCFVLVLGVTWWLLREPEPLQLGHPLSYWVEQLDAGPSVQSFLPVQIDRTREVDAIAGMGTNALPWLIKWIQYEESPWRTKVADLAERIPLELVRGYAESHIRNPHASVLASGATITFRALRERAAPAIPELDKLVNEGPPNTAERAAYALAAIGTNSLPVLLGAIRNREHAHRTQCIYALYCMPGVTNVSSEVVPVLAECVTDTTNEEIVASAVMVLGELKADPAISVPALITGLKSAHVSVRSFAAEALIGFGQKALIAVPALTNALSDTNGIVRFGAASALREIAPEQFKDLEVEGNER